MNTFTPYVVGTSCILTGGDTADHRMTELNELIASAKASATARSVERLHRTRFGCRDPRRLPPFLKTAPSDTRKHYAQLVHRLPAE
jgi:hypothetical protein